MNIASRMETNGTPGEIQITPATYELKDEFICCPRGSIPVKDKGEVKTWYLVERRSDDGRVERRRDAEMPEPSTRGHRAGGPSG